MSTLDIFFVASFFLFILMVVGLALEKENLYVPSIILWLATAIAAIPIAIIDSNQNYNEFMNNCTKTKSYYECLGINNYGNRDIVQSKDTTK